MDKRRTACGTAFPRGAWERVEAYVSWWVALRFTHLIRDCQLGYGTMPNEAIFQ